MEILLTGATGFIGSQLAHRFIEDGHKLTILVRPDSSLEVLQPSLSDIQVHSYDGSYASLMSALEATKPSLVIHVASLFLAQHKPEDVSRLIESNLNFPTQLLEAMCQVGITQMINTGTSWQHHLNDDYNPVNLYAATKQAFEALLEYYVQAKGFKVITLKLFDTYGPNDSRPKLFQLLSKAATGHESLDMSAGEQLIDLVHIKDILKAYLGAVRLFHDGLVVHHEQYAVSSGDPLPLKYIVQMYSEVTNQLISVNWGARQYRDREVMIPWNKGKSLPGWKPKINLHEGLSSLIEPKMN